MVRRSLRPQLNQIRAWVRQGRTDAWIAHQLEISATELSDFRRQHDLNAEDEEGGDADLRDAIEAEIEAAQDREVEEQDDEPDEPEDEDEAEEGPDGGEAEGRSPDEAGGDEGPADEGDEEPRGRRRRRGRRGGRRRGRKGGPVEATFDHGEKDGYGLWLDPSVQDNPAYAEYWAGQRAVNVTIEAERIVITRTGDDDRNGDE